MFEWLSVTFKWGFWKVSLSYYILFGLLGNSIYSLLIIIRSQIGDRPKKIVIGALAVSFFCCPLMYFFLSSQSPVGYRWVITMTVWLWYFIFIPQLLIYGITKSILTLDRKRYLPLIVLLRLVLTVALLICLLGLHFLIGELFHVVSV
jgi:hypothetical protein